jgi:hypothetical protein
VSRGFVAGHVGLEGAATNISAATKRQTPSIVGTRAVEVNDFTTKWIHAQQKVWHLSHRRFETQGKQECLWLTGTQTLRDSA